MIQKINPHIAMAINTMPIPFQIAGKPKKKIAARTNGPINQPPGLLWRYPY
jgi:hypothetical protein